MDFTNEMVEMNFLEIAEALDALNSEMYCVKTACAEIGKLVILLSFWQEKVKATAEKSRQCAKDVMQ